MGGSDDDSNLVKLTAREHYIAHLLLSRMYPENYKLKYAVLMMKANASTNQRNYRINSTLYESIRKKASIGFSMMFSGSKNPLFGAKFKWITNTITLENKRVDTSFVLTEDMMSNGWKYGLY